MTVGKPGRPVRLEHSPNSCQGGCTASPYRQGRAELESLGAEMVV